VNDDDATHATVELIHSKKRSIKSGFSGKSKKVIQDGKKDQFFESMDARIFRIGRMLVEQQLADFGEEKSLLRFVCCGDLNALKESIDVLPDEDKRIEAVMHKDGAGATIIHIAYLFQNFHIGRYLVDRFPELSTVRYDAVEEVEGDCRMMPYLGENIMHIAIAHRAHDEVEWLLNFYKEKPKLLMELLGARAFGHFFQPSHKSIGLYFGELPIHFAACSNDFVLFDLLLEADPNAIFFHDSYGNNVLHLCTIHQLVRMFDYISNHVKLIIRKQLTISLKEKEKKEVVDWSQFDNYAECLMNEKFLHIYNNESLTPFTLAAKAGKRDVFGHIMAMKTTKQWSYGPVDCSVVDLVHFENYRGGMLKPEPPIKTKFLSKLNHARRELSKGRSEDVEFTEYCYPDLEKDEEYMRSLSLHVWTEDEKPLRLGALEYICQGHEEGTFEMLNVPEVKEFIQKKWDRFGYPFFLKSSLFGIFRTLCVTLIIIFYEFGENDAAADWIIFLLYPFTWCVMMFNFKSDIYQVYKYGFSHWGWDGTIRGAGLLENVCSTAEFVFFTLAIFFRVYTVRFENNLGEDSSARTLVAMTTLTCWIRILYIFMGFESTGNFVIIVANILLNDIPLFMGIYTTILFGFGSAHAALSVNMFEERSVHNSIKHYFFFIWNIFRYTVDGQNNEVFDESLVQVNALWIYQILSSWYNVLIVLLLLNLLIAMLSDTYGKLIDKSSAILLRERYNMMCSFEKGMYDEEIKDAMQSYLIMSDDSAPVFEIQTTNPNWSKSGNADTDVFDEGTKGVPIDMPENVRTMATVGDTEALEKELVRLPKLVNCRDVAGGNLLHWSVSNGWFDTVEMLLSFNIDIHVCDFANKDTIMHDAVKAYCSSESEKREVCAQIITLLIQRGASYTRRNGDHLSPLDVAKELSGETSFLYYDEMVTLFKEGVKQHQTMVNGAKVELGKSRITNNASFRGYYRLTLMIIDPQVDFHPGGSLAVPTANEDSLRIQQFIHDHIDDIEDIVVTQDSHHLNHIAHGVFWEDKTGKSPLPFTQITHNEVCQGVWVPKNKSRVEYCKQYTKDLEGKGKFVLTIWPEHCLMGTPGHCVVPAVNSALLEWSRHQQKEVEYVMKGQNSLTEMYSAIMAEVPMVDDISTHLNAKLLRRLQSARQLVVCGQALSHCVNFTVRDLIAHWRSDTSRIHLMRDGCSSVPTFEKEGEVFVDEIRAAGVRIINAKDDFLKKDKDWK
jgi:nicotinamidase/pyrazinamidase